MSISPCVDASLNLLGTSFTVENPHLRRRAKLDVVWANVDKSHRISESLSDALCPVLKFVPRPFESMIWMAEVAGGQCFPFAVVFAVRSRHDDRAWPGELEQHSFECRQ